MIIKRKNIFSKLELVVMALNVISDAIDYISKVIAMHSITQVITNKTQHNQSINV